MKSLDDEDEDGAAAYLNKASHMSDRGGANTPAEPASSTYKQPDKNKKKKKKETETASTLKE